MSLPPIDSEKYFDYITREINADNILKWMEGNKQFFTNWHERYNIEVFKLAINNNIPIIDITSKFLEMKNYSELLIAEMIKEHIERRKIKLVN